MGSWVVNIYAWSTIWNFFDLTWPQQPPTEKLLKFIMSFHDSVKNVFFFKGAQLPCRRSKSVSWCTKLTAAILLIFIGTLLFFISHICVLSAGQYDLPKYLLIILRYYFVAFISKDSLLNHKESVHTKNFPLFDSYK